MHKSISEKCKFPLSLSFQMISLINANDGPSYGTIPISNSSNEKEHSIDDRFGILWIFLYLYITRIWGTVRYFILIVHDGSPYLPIVDKIDLALLYIQSLGDSAQAFINFIGFILIPYLCTKIKEKRQKIKVFIFKHSTQTKLCNRFNVLKSNGHKTYIKKVDFRICMYLHPTI